MRHDEQWAKERFAQARVARLATVSGVGAPHVVPIVFASRENKIITAVDHKPKSTNALRRLDNIAMNPFVSVLVDEYGEDWNQVWWARADGWAAVHDRYDVEPLVEKYEQYQEIRPSGAVIVIDIDHWSAWSSS